jgi:hypothetical protein
MDDAVIMARALSGEHFMRVRVEQSRHIRQIGWIDCKRLGCGGSHLRQQADGGSYQIAH